MQATFAPKQNKTTITNRNLSPAIWGGFPIAEIKENPGMGYFDYDDFASLPLQGTLTTQIAAGRYKVFGDTGNTITRVISNTGGAANATQLVPGGFLQLAIDTDNDECSIADSYPTVMMTNSAATGGGKICFECCYMQNGGVATGTGSVQSDAIPTNCASVFIGLANVAALTLSTTVPFNDADTISSGMYGVGFGILEDGLGVVNAVVTNGATSFTNVQATVGTVTAWNPIKLGLIYDPAEIAAKRIRFFVNNVETSTPYTSAQLDLLTNVVANGLGRLAAFNADSAGATFKGCLKWWAIGQMYVPTR